MYGEAAKEETMSIDHSRRLVERIKKDGKYRHMNQRRNEFF
jgi:hypothetical protein